MALFLPAEWILPYASRNYTWKRSWSAGGPHCARRIWQRLHGSFLNRYMKPHGIPSRENWQKKLEQVGYGFHITNLPYWDESACYSFNMDEVLSIEAMTAELWELCLDAVQY